jgi:hypothetical protein
MAQTLDGIKNCTHNLANEILTNHKEDIKHTMMDHLIKYIEDNGANLMNPEILNQEIQHNIHHAILKIMNEDNIYNKQILYSLLNQPVTLDELTHAFFKYNARIKSESNSDLMALFLEEINNTKQGQMGGGGGVEKGSENLADNVLTSGSSSSDADTDSKPAEQKYDKQQDINDTIGKMLSLNQANISGNVINENIFNIYKQVIASAINDGLNKDTILKEMMVQIQKNSLNTIASYMQDQDKSIHISLLKLILNDDSNSAIKPLFQTVLSEFVSSPTKNNVLEIDNFKSFIQEKLLPKQLLSQVPSVIIQEQAPPTPPPQAGGKYRKRITKKRIYNSKTKSKSKSTSKKYTKKNSNVYSREFSSNKIDMKHNMKPKKKTRKNRQ